MRRSINIAVTTCAVLVLATSVVRMEVLAQAGADTHGVPPPTQLSAVDNPKTVPVKITKRVYDVKKLLSAPPMSKEAYAGQALWQQRCAYCHDGMGQPTYKTMGPWMDSDTVKEVGADAIKAITMAGTPRMPSFQYDLDAQQMNNVVEFLKTVSPTLKPTPAQLAGKSEAPGNNAE